MIPLMPLVAAKPTNAAPASFNAEERLLHSYFGHQHVHSMEIAKFWACESFRRPPLVSVLKKIRFEMDSTEWSLGAGVANADEDDDELGHVVLRNEAGVANLRAVDVVGVGNAPSVGSLHVVGLGEPLAMLLARRGKWRTLMICDSWER